MFKISKKATKRITKKVAKKAVKKTKAGLVPQVAAAKLSFNNLVGSVSRLHTEFSRQTAKTINIALTLRNWLIGAHIHEYELHGADRAKYGENLLKELSKTLTKKGIPGCDFPNLYKCLRFFRFYPQILGSLTLKLQSIDIERVTKEKILRSVTLKSSKKTNSKKEDIPQHTGEEVLERLSYTHIAQLVAVDDPYKRVFYETECMKGNWSVRELKRQIESLYFERTALSTNKEKLRKHVQQKAEIYEPKLVIRDPMVFEFLDIKPNEAMLEEDIEQRLLDRFQETLLEFGYGFCFEARQKRILIDGQYFFVDLLFYHRVLRCHVLLELKLTDFKPEYVGQLNTYVAWCKENMTEEGDNPPIGILLCTGKSNTLVKYALAGIDNNLFVSQYLAQLPSQEELLRIAKEC